MEIKMMMKGYFPAQWKAAQIVLVHIVYKVSGKLFLKRLLSTVENNGLIPNHQFGFRPRHVQ
jgi:hypothetical protein